jgi:hypothetical protein
VLANDVHCGTTRSAEVVNCRSRVPEGRVELAACRNRVLNESHERKSNERDSTGHAPPPGALSAHVRRRMSICCVWGPGTTLAAHLR